MRKSPHYLRRIIGVFLLAIGLISPSFVFSTSFFEDFKGLTSDRICKNHRRLSVILEEFYKKVESKIGDQQDDYFDSSEARRRYGSDFSFRKLVNLCNIGIEWIIKDSNGHEFITSSLDILTSRAYKRSNPLIFSSTSSFQWQNPIENFHLMAWPVSKEESYYFYSYENMKDYHTKKAPFTIGSLKDKNYQSTMPETVQKIKSFFSRCVSILEDVKKIEIAYGRLKGHEKKYIKCLDTLIGNTEQILFFENTDSGLILKWFRSTQSNSFGYEFFLEDYKKGKLDHLSINPSVLLKQGFLTKGTFQKEKLLLREALCKDELEKYSSLLDIQVNDYKRMTDSRNPFEEITAIYPLSEREELKVLHSEPLFSWWFKKHLNPMRKKKIQEFKSVKLQEKKEDLSLEGLEITPIIYIFTQRQTCLSCENIVQRTASGNYIPLLAFNEPYSVNYTLIGNCKISTGVDIQYPTSNLSQSSFCLDYDSLMNLKFIKSPLDASFPFFQINYKTAFLKSLQYLEDAQVKRKNHTKDLNETLIKEVDKDEPNFKEIMKSLLNSQAQFESKLEGEFSKFKKEQEEEIKKRSKINSLNNLIIVRLPFQYNLTLTKKGD